MTMQVVIGTTSFVDCETIIAVKGQPLLRVMVDPLRVTMITPDDLPSGRVVKIVENHQDLPATDVRVVAETQTVAVLWNYYFMLLAALVAPDQVNVHIDLRPLGINIYDDPSGFHVGNLHYSGAMITGTATAVALG